MAINFGHPPLRKGSILVGAVPLKGARPGEPTHKAVYITYKELMTHTLLNGTTGTGKTVLLQSMVCQAILNGDPIVLCDLKFDHKMIRAIYATACLCGREKDIQIVSPWGVINANNDLVGDYGTHSYNPFLTLTTENAITTAILSAASGDGQKNDYYENVKKENVQVLHSAFQSINPVFTPRDLWAAFEDPRALGILVANKKIDEEARFTIKQWIQQCGTERGAEEFKKKIYGTKMFYRSLGAGTLGKIMNTTKPDVYLARTYAENKITIFALPATLLGEGARELGKMLKAEALYFSGIVGAMAEEHEKTLLFFIDEYFELVVKEDLSITDKNRGSNFGNIFCFQTPSQIDLRMKDPAFKRSLFGNINNRIILRLTDVDDAEMIAAAMGSHESTTAYNLGESTIRSTNDYIISPTELLKLPNFHAVFQIQGRIEKGIICTLPASDFIMGVDRDIGKPTGDDCFKPTISNEGGIGLWEELKDSM